VFTDLILKFFTLSKLMCLLFTHILSAMISAHFIRQMRDRNSSHCPLPSTG